jgi:hypothetical protein
MTVNSADFGTFTLKRNCRDDLSPIQVFATGDCCINANMGRAVQHL